MALHPACPDLSGIYRGALCRNSVNIAPHLARSQCLINSKIYYNRNLCDANLRKGKEKYAHNLWIIGFRDGTVCCL